MVSVRDILQRKPPASLGMQSVQKFPKSFAQVLVTIRSAVNRRLNHSIWLSHKHPSSAAHTKYVEPFFLLASFVWWKGISGSTIHCKCNLAEAV